MVSRKKFLLLVKKIDEFDNCAVIDQEYEKLPVSRVFIVFEDRKSKIRLFKSATLKVKCVVGRNTARL